MTHQPYLSPEAGIGASSCWAITDLTRPPSLTVTIRGFLTPSRSTCAAGGPTGGPVARGHAGDADDHRSPTTTIGNTNDEYRCRGRHPVRRSTPGLPHRRRAVLPVLPGGHDVGQTPRRGRATGRRLHPCPGGHPRAVLHADQETLGQLGTRRPTTGGIPRRCRVRPRR